MPVGAIQPVPYLDRVDTLSMVEQRGVVYSMTRKCRVVFPTGQIPGDFTVLDAALTAALNAGGVGTAPMSFLSLGNTPLPQPYQNLVLIERGSEVVLEDPGCVDVTMKYEHILNGPNQQLKAPFRGVIYGKSRCSVTQKPTNFYNPNNVGPQPGVLIGVSPDGFKGTLTMGFLNNGLQPGQMISLLFVVNGSSVLLQATIQTINGTTINFVLSGGQPGLPPVGTTINVSPVSPGRFATRQQILVAHTYPAYDPDLAGLTIYPGFPNTVFQTGEVTVPWTQDNFQFEGLLTTDNPRAIARELNRSVNLAVWLGDPPGTWLCSEVVFDIHDTAGDVYKFKFEFQYDPDGWNPLAVFNDQRTSRPPANVQPATITDANGVLNQAKNPITGNVQPAGYWQVPILKPIDYEAYFSAYFEGFQPAPVGG